MKPLKKNRIQFSENKVLRLRSFLQKALLSEEDIGLLAIVRKCINDPKEIFEEITLDDL